MIYEWRPVLTGLPQPANKQVLQLTNGLRLEIIQTRFRSETTDRTYGARLLYTSPDSMQSCIWYQDDVPEDPVRGLDGVKTAVLRDAIKYVQDRIDELTPIQTALGSAWAELEED